MSRSATRCSTALLCFCISSSLASVVSWADLEENAPVPAQPLSTTVPYTHSKSSKVSTAAVDDATHLIDLYNFEFLKQVPKCDSSIQALIAIHTAPANNVKRSFIRQTWGNMSLINTPPFRVIFLLGNVESVEMQKILAEEHTINGDIVQGSFMDAYRNLTYKHAMGLKWFQYYCHHAQVYIKMDDDRLLNTPLLAKYLLGARRHDSGMRTDMESFDAALYANVTDYRFDASKYLFRQPKNLIFCDKRVGHKVIRTPGYKWTVIKSEYPLEIYPTHCPGYANIYSADVVARLYAAAQRVRYFWIDDVHISGIVRAHIGVEIMNFRHYGVSNVEQVAAASAKQPNFVSDFLFSLADLSSLDQFLMWQLAKATTFQAPAFAVDPTIENVMARHPIG